MILIPDPQGQVLAHRLRQGVEQDRGVSLPVSRGSQMPAFPSEACGQ